MNLITRHASFGLLLLILGQSAFGCLNGRPVIDFGSYIDMSGSAELFMERFTTRKDSKGYIYDHDRDSRARISAIEKDLHYSVMMVRDGRYAEAITLLENRENLNPGVYGVAANLGTAYELSGDNEKALQWIKTGMERNPESHFGTEWLHVKILEAKIALAKDPEWLRHNSVLGLDSEKLSLESSIEFGGRKINIADIEKALIYQLHERMFFVKPPEAIVGDLLADLARVLKITRTVEHSTAVSQLALKYGAIQDRKLDKTSEAKSTVLIYAGVVAALVSILGFFAFFMRRKSAPDSINLN